MHEMVRHVNGSGGKMFRLQFHNAHLFINTHDVNYQSLRIVRVIHDFVGLIPPFSLT